MSSHSRINKYTLHWTLGCLFVASMLLPLKGYAEEFGAKASNRHLVSEMSTHLISIGELNVAESLVQEHLSEDPDDAESWALLSLVSTEKGDFAKAAKSIAKAEKLAGPKNKATIQYQKAYLAAAKGDKQAADQILAELEAEPGAMGAKSRDARKALGSGQKPPSLVARQVTPKAEELPSKAPDVQEPVEKPLNIAFMGSGGAGIRVGYDTNILSLPDSIAPSFSGEESAFSGLSAQGLAGVAIGRQLFTGSAVFASTTHQNVIAKNLNNALLMLSLQWRPGIATSSRFTLGLGIDRTSLWMNSDGYKLFQTSMAPKLTLGYGFNDSLSIESNISSTKSEYPGVTPSSADDDRSGTTTAADFTVRKILGLSSLSVGFGLSRHDANGLNFDATGKSLSASLSRPISAIEGDVTAGVSTGLTNYPNSLEGRYDQTLGFNSGINKSLNGFIKGMSGSLNYEFTKSKSSTDDSAIRKHVISAAVNYVPTK